MIRLEFPAQELTITLIADEKNICVYTHHGMYEFVKTDITNNYTTLVANKGDIIIDFKLLNDLDTLGNTFKKSSYWRAYYTIHLEFDDYAKVVEQLKKWKYGTI